MFAGIDKNKLYTPFNIASGIILLIGAILTVLRFTGGLSMVTNLDDNNPWGLWIGFDLLCGVALAAGGYVTSSAVYIFGMKKYHSAVRPAILTGFLGYAFVVFALMYDLGRPYRLPYPFVVQSGPTSFLFEVGLCVALYLTVLFIEFSPAAWEFLGWKKLRKIAHSPDHLRGCALHPAPVLSWRAVPPRAVQAASVVVLGLSAVVLLCVQHRCRAVHGHVRRVPGPQALS